MVAKLCELLRLRTLCFNMQLGRKKIEVFFLDQVPGNFHVSTHASRQQPENPDMTHFVHKVAFGHEVKVITNGTMR